MLFGIIACFWGSAASAQGWLPLGFSPTFQSNVLAINSLVAYWKMEDSPTCSTLVDSSGSGLTATVAGGVTCGSTPMLAGQNVTSVLFNGTTGTASLGAAGKAFFDWEYTQPWTIAALVKTPTTNAVYGLFSKVNSVAPFTGFEVNIAPNGTSAFLQAYLINNFGGNTYIQCTGVIPVPPGSLVVVSWTGSGLASGMTFYVNGVQDTPACHDTLGGQSIRNAITPQIGSRNGATDFFSGNIQELAIYNVAVGQLTATMTNPANTLTAAKPFQQYGLAINRALPANHTNPTVILIDQGNDVNSIDAAGIAAGFHNRGEINLVGYIADTVNSADADAYFALLKYTLPGITQSFIGAWQGAVPTTNGSSLNAFSAYLSNSANNLGGTNTARTGYTDGVQKLRALLNANPTADVVSLGFAVTVDGLLTSSANAGGDGLPSGLTLATGHRLVWCAGLWPNSAPPAYSGTSNNPEFNFANGPPANASDIFNSWPGEIIIVGVELGGQFVGTGVLGGPPPANGTIPPNSATNPYLAGWNQSGSASPRNQWDTIALAWVARGVNSGLEIAGYGGTGLVNSSTGANTWTWAAPTSTAKVSWLRQSAASSNFTNLVASMYAALPGHF
jgi:hypothetical protein